MLLLWILVGYILISVLLYFICRAKCKNDPVFRAPKSKAAYYILSLTWGLPTAAAGAIIAVIIRLLGHKSEKYGMVRCFQIKGITWGVSFGLFFIAPKGGSERIRMHEHGHALQNIYLGVFHPAVVALPSAVRFWYRIIRQRLGKPCRAAYDDIWFERSASESGRALMDSLRRE